MRRIVSLGLVPVASLAFAWAPVLSGAEGDPGATPGTAPATVVSTTMAKKGRVHYGPSLQSKDAAVLDAGTPVEVLGVAKGMPDWYAIRFPRQGTMWVHEKVLEPLEGGKTFRVNEDRARARDDATMGAGVVAELAKGEVVEAKLVGDKPRKVGNWQAVYAASAVAYVHKSVLSLPAAAAAVAAVAPPAQQPVDAKAQHQWLYAKALYARYHQVLDDNLEQAATLDWTYLSNQLGEVAKQHSLLQTRVDAQRLKDGIAKVVAAVEKVQRENHVTPTRDVPGMPPIVVADEPAPAVATAPEKPATPVAPEKPATPVAPEKPATPEKPVATEPGPAKPATPPGPAVTGTDDLKAARSSAPSAVDFVVTGLLNEQAFPKLGTNHVVIDQNGAVLAFLKVKPGSAVQLSEYYWRNVGVKGEIQAVDPELHGLGKKIPLVLVDDVMLIQ